MSNALLLRRRAASVSKKPDYFKITALSDNVNLSLTKDNNAKYIPIEYSFNYGEFTLYTYGTSLNFNTGDNVRWRRAKGYTSGYLCTSSGLYQFNCNRGAFRCTGDIRYLLDFECNVGEISIFAFYRLFSNGMVYYDLKFSNKINRIGTAAFKDCWDLCADVVIPGSISTIEEELFYRCASLHSVTFEEGVENIGVNAFRFCAYMNYLETVILPKSVNYIHKLAFADCTHVGSYIILAINPPTLTSTNAFTNAPIYVPYSADHSIINAYKNANIWSAMANRIFELDENGNIPVAS
jgi:hypothetical protein